MNFKETIKNDVFNVFLNGSEFAAEHMVNGKAICAVLQDETLDTARISIDGAGRLANGIYGGGAVLYTAVEDMAKPKPQALIEIDGRKYIVQSTAKVGAMYEIYMKRYSAR